MIDYRVLLFTAVLSLVTPLLCALAPAIQASRIDLNDTLKDTSARAAGGRRGRSLLVVSQVALAVTLLVVAGLAVRTALAIQRMDLGFDTAEILTLQLDVPTRPTRPTPRSDCSTRSSSRGSDSCPASQPRGSLVACPSSAAAASRRV